MPTVNKKYLDLDGLEYYNDKIQDKLDAKVDSSSMSDYYTKSQTDANIATEAAARQSADTILQTQINSLASGSPLVASSTGGMTDTSRVYVNTTDGKWYYYNGSTWVAGGTYQAVGLGIGDVHLNNLDARLTDAVFNECTDVTVLGLGSSNYFSQTAGYLTTTPFIIKAGTTITFSNDFVSNYHWALRKIKSNGIQIDSIVKADSTDTSYTVLEDMLACITWAPIDNNWSTTDYTVNRNHYLDNNDVTSIKFYYPKLETNTLVDLDINLLKMSLFCTGLSGTYFYNDSARLSLSRPIKSDVDIVYSWDSDVDFGVVTWDLSDGIDNKVKLTDSGWKNNTEVIIPAGTYFTSTCKLHAGGSFANIPNLQDKMHLRSYGTLNYIRSYVDSYASGVGNYNYTGIGLDLQYKHGYDISNLYNTSLVTSSSQGFDIYNNQYLVQLYNGGTLQILDYSNGSQISVIQNIGFSHGDCCQFSNTFYDDSDLLPLLYVTSDTTPSVVYVVRIRNTSTATIIKSYNLGNEAGYYAGHCFDFANNILYCFGYKQNEFHTNTGGTNNTIISVYDMGQETLISGTEYSLALLDRYEKPFIYCIQGQKFINGMCYLVSSYDLSEQKTYIYIYDPIRKNFVAQFKDMPNDIANYETEDIAFVKGNNKYEIIVGTRAKYMKLSFID